MRGVGSIMASSGEEIFNRLQARVDQDQQARADAVKTAMTRWRETVLRILPMYRAAAPELASRGERLMTRISYTGTTEVRGKWGKAKPVQQVRTVGWFMLSRTFKTY